MNVIVSFPLCVRPRTLSTEIVVHRCRSKDMCVYLKPLCRDSKACCRVRMGRTFRPGIGGSLTLVPVREHHDGLKHLPLPFDPGGSLGTTSGNCRMLTPSVQRKGRKLIAHGRFASVTAMCGVHVKRLAVAYRNRGVLILQTNPGYRSSKSEPYPMNRFLSSESGDEEMLDSLWVHLFYGFLPVLGVEYALDETLEDSEVLGLASRKRVPK
ncbi:hypothetical protein EDD15DRAFT_2517684 [Pisolithus albus]|nr:hypothetical protein EDD15DRAFT_2517684 [Pisolithus albus]